MGVFTYNGVDYQWGPPLAVIGRELTPTSHGRDLKYCLLQEEPNPVRKYQQQVLVLYALGPRLTQASSPPRGLWAPYVSHCMGNCVVLFFFLSL